MESLLFFQTNKEPLQVERSTKLFESDSLLFRNVLYLCSGLLGLFLVCGLLMECISRSWTRDKVSSEGTIHRTRKSVIIHFIYPSYFYPFLFLPSCLPLSFYPPYVHPLILPLCRPSFHGLFYPFLPFFF